MSSKVESTISPFQLFSHPPINSEKRAEEVTLPPVDHKITSKPVLNPIPFLLQVNDKGIKTAEGLMEFNIKDWEVQRQELNVLRKKQLEQLAKTIESEESSLFWSFLTKIGQVVLAAISTVLGFSLLASGGAPLAAGALVASGLLTVANVALQETGGWDWIADQIAEKDKELRDNIRTIVPATIGLVCGIGSLFTIGLNLESLNLLQQTLSIAVSAANISMGITTFMSGIAQGHALLEEAKDMSFKRDIYKKNDKADSLLGRFNFCQGQIKKELKNASAFIETRFHI
jgi:hypothetical protein